jgi:aerobic carbon-monoxide dehydrogenase large subunit
VIERLVDLAPDQLGFDPVAMRRQNMIPPRPTPIHWASPTTAAATKTPCIRHWRSPIGTAYRPGAPKRENAASCGGIGIANYVEITNGAPRERTEITVLPEGRVELVMGTMSSGQGHEH